MTKRLEDIANDIITEEAKLVLAKLENGKLYGIPIDIDNIEHLIAGAYFLGKHEELEYRVKAMKQVTEGINKNFWVFGI